MALKAQKRRFIKAILKILVAFNGLFFLCFVIYAERLPVKTYTVSSGLLRDEIYKIRQDSRGFLWICTGEGVSRFDGAGFTNFTVADGLPNRFAYDFLETRDGAIYIATRKGLARLNPHGLPGSKEKPLFTILLPDNPKAEKIQTLFEDRKGWIWVGTSDGLYKLTESEGQSALEPTALGEMRFESLPVSEIIEDRQGTLWIGTSEGLFRLAQDGDTRHLTTENKLPYNKIASLLEDGEGQIWAGFRETGGLCLIDAKTVEVKKCYSEKDGLSANWIPDLLQTSDGRIWAATVRGLCLWQGETGGKPVCKTYTEKNDLCHGITSLVEDKDDNLWVGSVCGAKKIARYGFMTYGEEDGLDYAYSNSIFENRAGELFATSHGDRRKISRFDGDKFLTVEPRFSEKIGYFGWGWQQTIWQDSSGTWWIPTGAGVFRTAPTDFEDLARVTAERQSFEKKAKEVFRLFEDSRGDIWIGTTFDSENGLWRWERSTRRWHDYTQQAGLTRIVSAFVEDPDGSIWIGTGSDDSVRYYEGLIIRYRDGEFRRFTEKEGAPRGWMRDLFLDSRGKLWIASTEDGLFMLDEPNANNLNFARYTSANGLTSNAIASITEDQFGRIYVGTWRGIDRLTPETGQIENFTTADGLPAGFVETSYRDRNNNLWFATSKGLARFQPEPVRQRNPPTILITGLRVDGEPQSVSILGETEIPPLELNSDQRQVSVDFLGLGASLSEKLKYEYRFSDSDWTLTDERAVNFANLSAGNYRFEVRAVTADRIYSPSAFFSFSIAAPFWQRPWFVFLVATALAGLIYLFYRARLQRLLEVERMRTHIATDLHDDIGANLTKIAILSEVAHQRFAHSTNGADELLPSIAEISRESVSAMSDIVWAINPKKDTLQDLTRRMLKHAREVVEQREIRLEFNAPAEEHEHRLDANARRSIYLIFKESLNNIARHANASAVKINLEINGSEFVLSISDDGYGFDTEMEYDGNGLMSMKKRAADFGGRIEINSSAGKGTHIVLRFSL